MEFAVNYSPLLAQMVREGSLQVDRFKCPAWPDLLEDAQKAGPVYIHFPLAIGSGLGGPIDEEKKTLADLDRFAGLLEATGTPLVNTHFAPRANHYPDLPVETREPRHIRQVLDGALRDLEPLLKRFGPERVTIENIINEFGNLWMATDPEVIARLLEESGCGFLFDQAHARLSARRQGWDERAYIRQLPLHQAKEIHVTGLRILEGPVLEKLIAVGDPQGMAKHMAGQWLDHLAMTDVDWVELDWLLGILKETWAGRTGGGARSSNVGEVNTAAGSSSNVGEANTAAGCESRLSGAASSSGAAAGCESRLSGAAWVMALEFGGVGGFWDYLSTRETYLEQVPRMREMIHAAIRQ